MRVLRSNDITRVMMLETSVFNGGMLSRVRAAASAVATARRDYDEICESALLRTRAALKRVWQESPDLAWSLHTLGEGVEQSHARLISHSGPPDARYRKHELVFARIAARAAMKTSPLSRFTQTIIHPPSEHRGGLRHRPFSFHNAALFELYEAAALSDEGIDHFAWEVRPFTSVVDGHVVAYTEEWNSGSGSVYRTRDGAIRLPARPVLAAIVNSGSPWTVARLSTELGLSDGSARKLLRRLASVGVVRPADLPSDRTDLALAIADRIRDRPTATLTPALGELETALRDLSAELDSLNAAPSRTSLSKAMRGLAAVRDRWGAHGDRPPSRLVYEDSVRLGGASSPLPDSATEDLGRFLALWPLFDVNVRIQLTFAAAARAAWGDGASRTAEDPLFFRLASDANVAYRSFWSDPWARIPTTVPDISVLDDLREEFVARLRDESAAGEIRLEAAFLDGLRSRIPDSVSRLAAAYSVFHMTDANGDVVLNKLYPGHLAFLGRFLRHLPVSDSDRSLVEEYYSRGDIAPAEIYETCGFNAAARPESMFHRRVVTRYTRDRAADANYEQVVDLSTATVDVTETRPVVIAPAGERLQPVLTSNLIRAFFPAYTAFTTNLYSNINHAFEYLTLFLDALPDASDPDHVIASPRIRAGRVVLERRHWVVPATRLRVLAGPSVSESLGELIDLFDELSMPQRFYFQTRRAGNVGTPVRSISTGFTKPQFCDLDHPLLVKVFLNAIGNTDLVIVAEALPDRASAEEYIREFVVGGV
ncbi:hypothetical protein ASF87_03415 [Microbacterium sp. Leaf161]|nr:hypothetical protein ASF87_03415 [Microbacterium sp. Leaf161]